MDPQLIHPDAPHSPAFHDHDSSIHEQALATGIDPSDVSASFNQGEQRVKPKPRKSERDLGKTLLPVARVQKILKADKEMSTCGKDAVFLISVATEEFIKRLAQAGHQHAQRDKRSTVQQRDLATAVRTTQHEELAFLEDTIPPPMTLSRALELASQFDPNDLFAEPPATAQPRLPGGRRRAKGNLLVAGAGSEEAEPHEANEKAGINGREKLKGREREGGKGRGKAGGRLSNGDGHINGILPERSHASNISLQPHSQHSATNGAYRRASPHRTSSQSYAPHHHSTFNPAFHQEHAPLGHEDMDSQTSPHLFSHLHHHRHIHSPVHTHDPAAEQRVSPGVNSGHYDYPTSAVSQPYPSPSPEHLHGRDPRHATREPRFSPHSPRDQYFPPAMHHHPLPPLPAHYHALPAYDDHSATHSYAPDWRREPRDPYSRMDERR